MDTFKTLDSSIISLVILFIIFLHAYNRHERVFFQYKLFISLIVINIGLITVDILAWAFNGMPGDIARTCNIGFNVVLYTFVPLAPSVWVLYTYYLVNHDERKIKRNIKILAVLLAANAAISVVSIWTGWFFSVDAGNVYHRGPIFPAHLAYCGMLIAYSLIFVCLKRKHFQKRQFYSMLLFFVPQVVGSTLQAVFYGVSYNWTGMMISMLIIYFNFQSRDMNTDYLTGANNRMHLQGYIKAKIRSSGENRTFCAIMVDIDDFKTINDRFGHLVGDEALQDTARILKESLRRDDFIARYGGDEFVVVMDADTAQTLDTAVSAILAGVDKFNANSKAPYQLRLSLGYDVYDAKRRLTPDEFLMHIDQLMYIDKKRKAQ